jgi:hypothetical protein
MQRNDLRSFAGGCKFGLGLIPRAAQLRGE